MCFTVYKITNLINNKIYIGVHKTLNPNDSYMGSGKAIKAAICKHGKENFKKEILFIFENAEDAYKKEYELTENFDKRDTYNMKRGGVGGFSKEDVRKGYEASLKLRTKEQLSAQGKKASAKNRGNINLIAAGRKTGLSNKGKPKSEAHKQKLRESWIIKKQNKL